MDKQVVSNLRFPRKFEKKYYVGVDLGGSKILVGIFDESLNLIATDKKKTKPERGVDTVIERICNAIWELLDDYDIAMEEVVAIGVGTPGSVDLSGNVIFAGNLNWKNVPLRHNLEEILKVPVYIDNDGNVAVLGIYHVELLLQPENVVGIFVGTGLGGGLILNRKLYRGSSLVAGELGHTVIDVNGELCNCGNKGCLETFASRVAILKRVQSAVDHGEKTYLSQIPGKMISEMRSRDILKAILRGDECVKRIVTEAAYYTGIAVANIINLLNPDVIALGGGIIDALEEYMLPEIEKTARKYAFPGTTERLKIYASKLGDNAGITGAAALAITSSESKKVETLSV